ncbi:MAG TPA: NPCBM/NEW2 domain-containing protein [Verrucomicrobiae bacterium]
MRKGCIPFLLAAVLLPVTARALTNNLALTPPMGWNDWNAYHCGISENVVTNNAAIMVAKGLKAAGYQYVDIDDGWAASRDSNGVIEAYTNFPDGIPVVANYVHSLGLKLGVYTDNGTNTCSTCISESYNPVGKDPGSFNYEYVDAFAYAEFGADYLKDDNCNAFGESGQVVYGRMSDGLMKSGRPILLCLCGSENGNTKMYQSWSPDVGNYWRTTGDIGSTFASMISHIDPNSMTAFVAGPGRWNDPDMLEIGNGEFATNLAGAQTHFTMWCEMAAPLVMGNNLTTISAQTLQILTNAEAIAVDQDPAGEQGVLVEGVKDSAEVWSKPLGYDFTTRAVALLNRSTSNSAVITCNFTNLAFLAGTAATVRDLWTHQDLGMFTNSFTATVPPYSSMLLKIVGTPISPPAPGTNYLSDQEPIYAYTGWGAIAPDKSIGGTNITLGGISYPHGIGVNSFSGIEYNLGGVCSRFQATIGIDDEEGTKGTVIFEVFADGERIFKSGVIAGGSPAQNIDLDVTGVRRLTLGVDDADDGNSYDHADWANALVIATNTPQLPGTPTGLTASPGEDIVLNWNPSLAAISYNVKRATISGGPYSTIANVPVTTFTDSNVVSGTAYYYAVSAVSGFGESTNSGEVSAAPCNVPSPPANVLTVGSNSLVTITWNSSAGATSYNVYRFTGSTPPIPIASGLVATHFTDSPVGAAATNYYLVTAANACNQSGWSAFDGAVTPPAAPTGLTATPGNSEVEIDWNGPAGGAAFNVKRSNANGGPYTTIASNVTGTGYLDYAVTNGVTYYYVVSALNTGGEGPDSIQASVTPLAPVTAYWTNTATVTAQNWNLNVNWTNTPVFPNSAGELAVISANIAGPQTIHLNQTVTIGSLEIGAANGAAGYTLAANGGSLQMSAAGTMTLTQLPSSRGDVLATPISITTNLVIINDSENPLTLAGPLASSGGAVTLGSGVLQIGDSTTNGSLGSVNVTDSGTLIFNRSDSVAMSGVISGAGAVEQNGTGTLELSGSNTFIGGLTIQNGTVQAGNPSALGALGGTVVITNNGTLDVNGFSVTNVAVTISGWGVNSNGAIISSGSSSQLHGIQSVTLAGDTAFGGPGNWLASGNPGRWDIRNAGTTLTMSGGKPFNLYKIGSNQVSFVGVTIDTNLGNVDIRQGMLGFEAGSTSMGNPASNLVVRAGATLEFYQSSAARNSYTKQFMLYGNGAAPSITNWPGGGNSTIFGQMTLNGTCVIGVNGTSFTNDCVIAGGGNLVKTGLQPLTLGGMNTYTGTTTLDSGKTILRGNGSIAGCSSIIVNAGATLDASGRTDTTLTLAGGQALTGAGAVNGSAIVTTGATIEPGGGLTALVFSNNLTLEAGSTTLIEIDKSVSPTNDSAQVAGTLTYGGTLVVTNIGAVPFAAGDSFKLFSAVNYLGAFTGVAPAIPAVNLAWNTNGLGNGVLSVVSMPTARPQFSGISARESTFVFSGGKGVPYWTYYVLASTNPGLPLAEWIRVSTNSFDAAGNFSFTNAAWPGMPETFYLLKLQ